MPITCTRNEVTYKDLVCSTWLIVFQNIKEALELRNARAPDFISLEM